MAINRGRAWRYNMDKSLKLRILNAICYTCSGRNSNDDPIYRFYENFQELYEHCGSQHNHDIAKHSYINIKIDPKDWCLLRTIISPPKYVLMRQDTVKKYLESKIKTIKNESVRFKPKNLKGGGPNPNETALSTKKSFNDGFSIYGWNARSAATEENIYFISAFLTQTKPDFLLINESGKYNNRICKNCPEYKSYHSKNRLTLFYDTSISVTPILQDTWDDTFLVVKATMCGKSMILINVYRPPHDEDATERITTKISLVDKRYRSTSIIVFGDLNYRRGDVNKAFKELEQRGFVIIYDINPESFTRSQLVLGNLKKSYLDYFMIKEVKNQKMRICDPIGRSDHKSLVININDDNMRIRRAVNLKMQFSKILHNYQIITMRMIEALSNPDPIISMRSLIFNLRREYQPVKRKVKSYFKLIEGVTINNDQETTKKLIRNSNRGIFQEFMNAFETLKATKRDKEYFLRLRFYSDLNSNVGILNNICIEEDSETVVSNDTNVIYEVVFQKYSELFRSYYFRTPIKTLNNNEVLIYTDQIIIEALKNLNLNKATSWDCIPGKSFEAFNNNKLVTYLTNFINKLVQGETIPPEFALGRLFCLNKNNNEPGNIKSIRPLVILSTIIKIIEYPLNLELKKVKLNQAQLGFRDRLSTELNIMRLRSKIHSMQVEYTTGFKKKPPKRYILLVDLSEAFDRVNHEILIRKMREKEVPIPVLNILIKLLNCGSISLDMNKTINVKSGVGQGKICSPLEFDIYINDLLDKLSSIAHTCLAFADDTAYICRDLKELHEVIKHLTKWSEENKIQINRKKSGILIINDDSVDGNMIEGFPVVGEYNYLGIVIDSKINPRPHIKKIREKLQVYLSRNKALQKKYFTPFSLLRIIESFVKSRLSYGISCFLDDRLCIDKINSVLFDHIKSLFDLPGNTSHNRLQLALGEPSITCRLAVRALKNWHKYFEHFREFPIELKPTLEKYFTSEELSSPCDYNSLFDRLTNNEMKKISAQYKILIRSDHRKYLKKYMYTYPDKRDYYLIRFFTNTTKATNERLVEICVCGETNNGEHSLNKCEKIMNDEEREEFKKKMRLLLIQCGITMDKNITLYEMCVLVYYSFDKEANNETKIRKLVEILKQVVLKTIFNYKDE
jgi:hypothetical protein